jgi:hypothetical protein
MEQSSNSEPANYDSDPAYRADLVIRGLELGEKLAQSDYIPVSQERRITIHPELLHKVSEEYWPEEFDCIPRDRLGVDVTFNWQHPVERPNLEIQLFDVAKGDCPVATFERSGAVQYATEAFRGAVIGEDNKERPYAISNDEIAELVEEIISPKGFHIIDTHGVNHIAKKLIKELVTDAQYPPIARYIQSTLIEQGSESNSRLRYELPFGDELYEIEILLDNETVTGIEIVNVLSDKIEIRETELQHNKHGIGATVSIHDLGNTIQFFTIDSDERQNIAGDNGDFLFFSEVVDKLTTYLD